MQAHGRERLTDLFLMMDANNPKDHDIGAIIESMRRYGYVERIILNIRPDNTKKVIAGHGRIIALSQMQSVDSNDCPDGVERDDINDTWIVLVDYIRIKPDDEPAVAIALNRITEKGGWDEAGLAKILAEIGSQDLSKMEATGFSADDLDELINNLGFSDDGGDDNKPEDSAQPVLQDGDVQVGDIWSVGDKAMVGVLKDWPYFYDMVEKMADLSDLDLMHPDVLTVTIGADDNNKLMFVIAKSKNIALNKINQLADGDLDSVSLQNRED